MAVVHALAKGDRELLPEALLAADSVVVEVKQRDGEALGETQPEAEALALRQALAEGEVVPVVHALAMEDRELLPEALLATESVVVEVEQRDGEALGVTQPEAEAVAH